MKKLVSILLIVCMLLSVLCLTVSAAPAALAGDVNNDGKVTPYDALQVQAFLHGELSLTSAQQQAAIAACPSISTLSTAHIVAIFFKPLVGQNSIAPEEDGLFHISSAEDMALLRSFPYAGFSIDDDIDMSGKSWTPIIFNGFVFGNNHTISNLTASPANNNVSAGALFVKLGSASNPNAAVSDLTIADSTLTTNSAHKYVGLVCGTNYGRISNVTVANGNIAGSINSTTKIVGAQTGMNYGTVSDYHSIDWNVAYACTTQNVVGSNAGSGVATTTGEYIITKNGAVADEKIQLSDTNVNRQAAVNYLEILGRIKWVNPYEKVTYRDSASAVYGDFVVDKNVTYYGSRYGHEGASMEAMLSQMTLVGDTYQVNRQWESYSYESPTVWSLPYDVIIMGDYFTNDCSTAVQWAMNQVSGTMISERTSHMVPNATNVAKYGVLPVGNVDLTVSPSENHTAWNTGSTYADPQVRSILTNEDGTVNEDRLNALYEAYALCQPGDGLVHGDRYINSSDAQSTDGHSKLVVSVNVVRYTSGENAGKINPDASTITTIECGGGADNDAWSGTSAWHKNTIKFWKYAGFKSALEASVLALNSAKRYRVYVPFTCRELATGTREAAYFRLTDSTSPYSGIVSSNYRIEWTSVTVDGVTDKSFTGTHPLYNNNNIQYEGIDPSLWVAANGDTYGYTSAKTLKSISSSHTEACRMVYKSVNLAKHADAFASLEAGEHTYEVTVKLATGETQTWSGSFTIAE